MPQFAVGKSGTFHESFPRLARGRSLKAMSVPMTVATEPATNMMSNRPVSVIILLHTSRTSCSAPDILSAIRFDSSFLTQHLKIQNKGRDASS